jgi:hypothetical protein
MDPISKTFVAAIHRNCRDHDIPMIDFVKGQRKDDVAHEYLARFAEQEGVLFVGRAREKTRVFRTEKRRNPDTGGDLSVDRVGHRDRSTGRISSSV